jgi:hypothetical protein
MHNELTVYTKSFLFCVCACLPMLALYELLAGRCPDPVLRFATAFSVLQFATVIGLAVYLVVRRGFARYQRHVWEQLYPALEERLMTLAATGEKWHGRVPKRGTARQVLNECVGHALTTLKKSPRDRVVRFAVKEGFDVNWTKDCSESDAAQRIQAFEHLGMIGKPVDEQVLSAFESGSPAMRTAAARALLLAGKPADVERVFLTVLSETLLTRVLLAAELKRHASYLMAATIPAVLAGDNQTEIANCLELLASWQVALPLLDTVGLIKLPCEGRLRLRVLEILPYAPVEDAVEKFLLEQLASGDAELRGAAAVTAGRLSLNGLIPALSGLLGAEKRVGSASAAALADMGIPGRRQLETAVSGRDRRAAAAATEALEMTAVGAC